MAQFIKKKPGILQMPFLSLEPDEEPELGSSSSPGTEAQPSRFLTWYSIGSCSLSIPHQLYL